MSRIEITSRDAERIAKAFRDLIGRDGLQRIRRKAVNEIGAKVRKETRSLSGVVFNTSAAALSVRGKAAAPGSDNPAYRLRMAAKIPATKLRAKARKVTRSRGRARLALTLPGGGKVGFRSIRREGVRFVLERAGPLPERGVGGVFTNAARAFTTEGYDELRGLRREAERDLPDAVARLINEHLKTRRR